MVHLCSYMPEPKDARRQIPDPVNEPDFEAISRLYPVLAKTAHISRPDGLLTLPEHNPTVKTAAAPAIVAQKVGMDRNAALEEIKRLRARLASDVAPLSRNAPTEPFAKRQAVLASGLLGQIPVRQLARMPQPFPTRARGLSQLEVILQRNAIVSAIRKQQQQESQQQQLQELQIQQQLQELRTQQQMEEIQAQQRQLQDLTTQQTLQHLQAQHVVSDFQKQHSLQELQLASAAHQLQQHHQLQDLRNQLALQNFQQPTSTTPTGLSSVSNAASFEEYLRRTSLFP